MFREQWFISCGESVVGVQISFNYKKGLGMSCRQRPLIAMIAKPGAQETLGHGREPVSAAEIPKGETSRTLWALTWALVCCTFPWWRLA